MNEQTSRAIDAQKMLTTTVALLVEVFGEKRAASMLRAAAAILKPDKK